MSGAQGRRSETAAGDDYLTGYFAGLRIPSTATAPADYLPPLQTVVDLADAQNANAALRELDDHVGRSLADGTLSPPLDVTALCRGFAAAVDLRADLWQAQLQEGARMRDVVSPLLAAGTDPDAFFRDGPDARNQLRDAVPELLAAAYALWRNPLLARGLDPE